MPVARRYSIVCLALILVAAPATGQPSAVPVAQDCTRGGPVAQVCLDALLTAAPGIAFTAGPTPVSSTDHVVGGTAERRQWPAAHVMPRAWPWLPGDLLDGFVARYRAGDAVARWVVPFSASSIQQLVPAPGGGLYVIGSSRSPRVPDPPASTVEFTDFRPFIAALDADGRLLSVVPHPFPNDTVIAVNEAGRLVIAGLSWLGLVDPSSGVVLGMRFLGVAARQRAGAGPDVLVLSGWEDGTVEPFSVSRWRGDDLVETGRVVLRGLARTSASAIAAADADHAWIAVVARGATLPLSRQCGPPDAGANDLLLLRVSWRDSALTSATCLARWRRPAVESLAVTDQGRVFAWSREAPAGESAGRFEPSVFRSENGGQTWSEANDGLPADPGPVPIVPASASVAYATPYGALFKTEDGGRSWRDVSPVADHFVELVVNPGRQEELWVRARPNSSYFEKRLLSRDGGTTWQETIPIVTPGQPAPLPRWFDATSERMWAMGTPGVVLVVSDDGARTWRPWGESGVYFMTGDPASRGYGTKSEYGFPLWWTADGAESWAPGLGLQAGGGVLEVSAAPGSPERAIAVTSTIEDGFSTWSTSNGGASWQRRGDAGPRGARSLRVGWTPAAEPVLYGWTPASDTVRESALFVSLDAGASWQARKGCGGCRSLVTAPAEPEVLFASADGLGFGAVRVFEPATPWPVFAADVRASRSAGAAAAAARALEELVTVPDADGNGLADAWERQFGPTLGGAAGDPDGDGVTNRDEMLGRTHPTGTWTAGFAEGFGPFLTTHVDVFNPDPVRVARVWFRLEADGQIVDTRLLLVPAVSYRTLMLPGDLAVAGEHAVVVESDLEVVVSRTSSWGGPYHAGVHASVASRPRPAWYFAEGSTQPGFELFYLLHNPGDVRADVRITWLPSSGGEPVLTSRTLPPHSRASLWANHDVPAIRGDDVAAIVESVDGAPILAERSLYRSGTHVAWSGGTSAAGAMRTSARWIFAEGVVGAGFATYVLLANPHEFPVEATVEYLRSDGSTHSRSHTLPARRRVTIDAASDLGSQEPVSFAVVVTAVQPIVAERATWWPFFGDGPWWRGDAEGHVGAGAVAPAASWWLAGAALGSRALPSRDLSWDTYLVIAKLSEAPDDLTVMVRTDGGVVAERHVMLPPGRRRVTLALSEFAGDRSDIRDQRLVVEVTAANAATELVVEQSVYGGRPYAWWGGAAIGGTPAGR